MSSHIVFSTRDGTRYELSKERMTYCVDSTNPSIKDFQSSGDLLIFPSVRAGRRAMLFARPGPGKDQHVPLILWTGEVCSIEYVGGAPGEKKFDRKSDA